MVKFENSDLDLGIDPKQLVYRKNIKQLDIVKNITGYQTVSIKEAFFCIIRNKVNSHLYHINLLFLYNNKEGESKYENWCFGTIFSLISNCGGLLWESINELLLLRHLTKQDKIIVFDYFREMFEYCFDKNIVYFTHNESGGNELKKFFIEVIGEKNVKIERSFYNQNSFNEQIMGCIKL